MNSPVEEIKSRLDLVEFIQSYVRLQKAGINYKAICPFHTEKTPSFFVSPARQIWHCFGGCSEGGDIFKFVMKIEGHDFPEALRMLAQRAGVVLKREDPTIRSERNRLYDLCEEAARVFERNLALTPAARVYLKKRGVKEETIQEFRVGFAPQSWDFLLKALALKGFKKEETEKAGLAIKSEDGASWYDRFRSRIMFPISDASGRVVGFSGRIFAAAHEQPRTGDNDTNSREQNEAKYVNTPNTLIYDKSRVLYGFDKAKQEIRAKNHVVVVEGQMDCLMSHQAGVKQTIAVSGTALTSQQLKILRRLCDTIVSSFDTDAAGESATKRSLALAAQFEFERRIAVIPSGKDPADAVLENPQLWIEAVAQAKPVVEFYFEKAFRKGNPSSAEAKKEISGILLPLIAELANEIEKAHWIGELAKRFSVSEDSIWRELRRPAPQSVYFRSPPEDKETMRSPLRREALEERLLALLTAVDNNVKTAELAKHHIIFTSSLNQELFEALCSSAAPAALAANLQGPLETLRFKSEVLAQTTQNLKEEFLVCKRELEKECIKERLLKLGEEIERREKEGNRAAVTSLLQDFREFSDKLKTLL